jgi:iron(II)-dependent oxidoreductase
MGRHGPVSRIGGEFSAELVGRRFNLDLRQSLMTASQVDAAHTPGGALSDLDGRALVAHMRDFRRRTLELVADLDDRQMIGPRLATVNPPLWEIGHIAWFAEFWLLRRLKKRPPLRADGDRLYNSTDVAHDTRWELLLPSREHTIDYMTEILERAIEYIDRAGGLTRAEWYFYLLALFHEGMHAEALAYTRQALAYAAPRFVGAIAEPPGAGPCRGDIEIPGGSFLVGATPDFPFVFDNEKWAHAVVLKPFRIARAPVTNGEFLAFVEAGGYREPRYWSSAGWQWRETGGAPQLQQQSFAKFFNSSMHKEAEPTDFTERLNHPAYWRRDTNGAWLERVYDRYLPLRENCPVVHVSWYEAEAYCNWAGRRLPSESEWEAAASAQPPDREHPGQRRHFPWGDRPATAAEANLDWRAPGVIEVGAHAAGDSALGCRQMIGNVWEWTASDFQPYPGFSADSYKEYSQPWFGTHKVLRGGCWTTSSLLIRNTWRNFYTPDRRDVWAGFRTCAR